MTTAQSTFKTIKKGFTLIELLIVIAILGVLAAAVLSAINPVEQINRGRDTGSLSDAEQLLSAVSRFNASQGYLPWTYGEGDSADTQDGTGNAVLVKVENAWVARSSANTLGATPVLDLLGPSTNGVGTGELLPAYQTRVTSATGNPLYIYNHGDAGDSTYVCFRSQSGAFQAKAQARCGANLGATKLPADLIPARDLICDATINGNANSYATCLP